jgi:kynurenine formamidase
MCLVNEQIDAMIRRVSNWGRWGERDELGTINLITPEVRLNAAATIRRGRVISLGIAFDRHGPQPSGDRRLNPQHVMLVSGADLKAGVHPLAVEGWGYADDMVMLATHGATHWDCLAHQFYDFKFYNNRDCALVGSHGACCCDASSFAPRVVTRGVLLDVARALGLEWLPIAHHITVAELEQTLDVEKVEPRAGDVLLIRTGNMTRARQSGDWSEYVYTDEPGIGLDALPWLHEHEIAGVAADTWAFEAIPSGVASIWLPVHAVGIVHMGLLVGEMFQLDELAADCAADGVYEFMLTAIPLPITGAVGAPVHPVAVK